MVGKILFALFCLYVISSLAVTLRIYSLCDLYNLEYPDFKFRCKLFRNGSKFTYLRRYYMLAIHHKFLFKIVYGEVKWQFAMREKRWSYFALLLVVGFLILILSLGLS